MWDTPGRLLRLLSLLQLRRDWPGPELAARLEVDVRTVRRDIDRLRALGYPVSSTSGAAGGYRLEPGTDLPPLLLDDDEAVAVAVCLRTAAGGTVAGIEEAALRALAKLDRLLPTRLRGRAGALSAATVAMTGQRPVIDADDLAAIAAACRDHEVLRFDYRTNDGATSRRTVEPLRLVHTGRLWYLVAWDRDRGDWRTFRVDRIGGHPVPVDTLHAAPAAGRGRRRLRLARHRGRGLPGQGPGRRARAARRGRGPRLPQRRPARGARRPTRACCTPAPGRSPTWPTTSRRWGSTSPSRSPTSCAATSPALADRLARAAREPAGDRPQVTSVICGSGGAAG